jgi:hypothetical protein
MLKLLFAQHALHILPEQVTHVKRECPKVGYKNRQRDHRRSGSKRVPPRNSQVGLMCHVYYL